MDVSMNEKVALAKYENGLSLICKMMKRICGNFCVWSCMAIYQIILSNILKWKWALKWCNLNVQAIMLWMVTM